MIDHLEDAFREESKELLAGLEDTLLELETDYENPDLIGKTFRILHTLKGSSGMFGFDNVSIFIHDIETAFEHIRNGEMSFTKEIADLTFKACDQVNLMIFNEGKGVDEECTKKIIETFRSMILNFNEEKKDEEPKTPVAEQEPKKLKTFKIEFKPQKEILSYGCDPMTNISELSEIGDLLSFCKVEEAELNESFNPEELKCFWEIYLTTVKSSDTVQDVFMFVEDLCELNIEILDDVIELSDWQVRENFISEYYESQAFHLEDFFSSKQSKNEIKENISNEKDTKKKSETTQSIRVSSDKLDDLVNLVGELVTVQSGLTQLADMINHSKLNSVSEQIERLVWELRDSALNIRMLTIGTTFNKFKRLVRDLSKELGKEVILTTEGAETELDKNVLEKLNDPLIHIIRNCIDHGIETPDVRKAKQKPSAGHVNLAAKQSGGNVVIEIEDDGAGLNKQAILKKAIASGIINEGEELTEFEINNLICQAGFSTSENITSVSGRGVGMDVVKQEIENLRGSVEIYSTENMGTKILLKIPLTLAIIDGLMVNISDNYYVIPLVSVEECVELTKRNIELNHGRHIIKIRDEIVPYIVLREFFNVPGERLEIEQIVIVNIKGSRIGFVVDEVMGQHQTVIKSLGTIYKNVDGISGATVMGDGGIALILDIFKLAQFRELEEIEAYS